MPGESENSWCSAQSADESPRGSEAAVSLDAISACVHANNRFALDLYHALTTNDEDDGNLFFSPHSVSTALMMALEGARNETADEMGLALRIPTSLRQANSPAAPWRTEHLHEGIAKLKAVIKGARGDDAETRDEITRLRSGIELANARAGDLEREHRWSEASEAARESQALASRLNALLASVDQYEIGIANALWVEETYSLHPDFLDVIERHYETEGL